MVIEVRPPAMFISVLKMKKLIILPASRFPRVKGENTWGYGKRLIGNDGGICDMIEKGGWVRYPPYTTDSNTKGDSI